MQDTGNFTPESGVFYANLSRNATPLEESEVNRGTFRLKKSTVVIPSQPHNPKATLHFWNRYLQSTDNGELNPRLTFLFRQGSVLF
jgi:hypothetical protein